jgi:Zn-dependent protease
MQKGGVQLPDLSIFPTIGMNPDLANGLMIFAGINLAFAILNAVPIPPLDGGNTLFALLEGIFGEKVRVVQGIFSVIGILAIIALVIYTAFFLT